MLFIFASVAYGREAPLAELNHFAGLHFSPMKLGALHDLRRLYGSFSLACEAPY